MACVELDDRILIVDCGLSFPSGDMPGIDLVLPDFDYVRRNAERIEAVVLTHGHEDHIGSLPYLLREIEEVPVYGTAFTLALLQGKLEEH
jgi:ribonuclease J